MRDWSGKLYSWEVLCDKYSDSNSSEAAGLNWLAYPGYESTFRWILDSFFQGSWTCKMFETQKSALSLCHHWCHGGSMADVCLASGLPPHHVPLLCTEQGIVMTKPQVPGWALWSSLPVLSGGLAAMTGLVWEIFAELSNVGFSVWLQSITTPHTICRVRYCMIVTSTADIKHTLLMTIQLENAS